MSSKLVFWVSILLVSVVLIVLAFNAWNAFQNLPVNPTQQCASIGQYFNPSTGRCESAGEVCEVITKFFPVHECPTGLTCRTSPFILWGVCQP